MAADHLLRAISLEPLGTRIPGGDMALGIEHVDDIVGDRVDQQLKALIGHIGVEPVRCGHEIPAGGGDRRRTPGLPGTGRAVATAISDLTVPLPQIAGTG